MTGVLPARVKRRRSRSTKNVLSTSNSCRIKDLEAEVKRLKKGLSEIAKVSANPLTQDVVAVNARPTIKIMRVIDYIWAQTSVLITPEGEG